jgi:hypothetical protein
MAILIILSRAFLAEIQFGKEQMGPLYLTSAASPSTDKPCCRLNWESQSMLRWRCQVMASGGSMAKLAWINDIANKVNVQ